MILWVAPDAEQVAGDLKSGSVRRSGDHLQFRTHPLLFFFTFWYQVSPRGTQNRPEAASEDALAAPNYVTFQSVAAKASARCTFGVARAFINAYPQDEVRKQKREART
jgi:hypothetical protein